ncbi:carbohydrate ABC transporter permease [Blautia sp. AM22-22LB]|nr:carbohydrate ABC transporter permease [Blautia sp. AM22-22LB]
MHGKIKKVFFRVIHYAIMVMITVLMLMPIGWMLGTSMRQSKESFVLPPSFWPTQFNLDNFKQVFHAIPILKFAWNSLFITFLAAAFMVLFTSMAAYAFARINFKGKNILFIFMLAGLMIPVQSIIVPVFLIIRKLNLIDTKWALIVTSIYYPLGLLMLRQFMMTIPKSYDEAAVCDGAGKLTIFFRVILPMSKSTIMVAFVMHFVSVWNNFFSAMIFLNSTAKMTLPLGITVLNTTDGNSNMPLMTAAVLLTLIPPMIIYIFGQKYLMQGNMISGVKS